MLYHEHQILRAHKRIAELDGDLRSLARAVTILVLILWMFSAALLVRVFL